MSRVAHRLSAVYPSASMTVSQVAKDLVAKGVDVLDLSLGEPDFGTPDHITEAAFAAARSERMLYTASLGSLDCRQAIAAKLRHDNGLEYAVDEIAVANGAKQIIFNAMMATVNEGDEVILPAPYFVSYPDMARLNGGVPVTPICAAKDGFRLTPELLETNLTKKTRWLFLNMPGNPTGAVYSESQLWALGKVLAKFPNVLILSDEIYEHIIFDGRKFVSFARACPELRDRTLVVNGVSKAYAMTGWRVGYGAGPKWLIRVLGTIQSQSCTSVCTPAQHAAIAALYGPQNHVVRSCAAFETRRNFVVAAIAKIDSLTLDPPGGAFYAYIGCRALIGKKTPAGKTIKSDVDVTEYLLKEGNVATVPGTAYGLSPFFRISTAASQAVLEIAITRITDAISELRS